MARARPERPQFLRDPYWPLHAARILGVDLPWPAQYERAKQEASVPPLRHQAN